MKRRSKKELTPWAKYQRAQKKSQPLSQKIKEFLPKDFPGINWKIWPSKNKENKASTAKKYSRVKNEVPFYQNKVVLTAAVLFLLILMYFISPLSRVHTISVNGNKRVATTAIKKESGMAKNQVILCSSFGESEAKKRILNNFSDIKNVKIKISFLGHARISIKENAKMGYVVRNKMYYTVRQDGSVLKQSHSQPDGDFPVFRGFKSSKVLKDFLNKYSKLPNIVQDDIAEVSYSNTKKEKKQLHLLMNDGNEVYAILPTFAKKMKYYPQISASMKKRGVIDLTVGAYSHPYGWKDPEEKTDKTPKKAVKSSSSTSSSASVRSSQSSSAVSNVNNR